MAINTKEGKLHKKDGEMEEVTPIPEKSTEEEEEFREVAKNKIRLKAKQKADIRTLALRGFLIGISLALMYVLFDLPKFIQIILRNIGHR